MTYEQRIRQELERVCGTEEWIRINCNPGNTDSFEVGTVARIGSETVFVQTIGTTGQDSGSRSISIESIMGVTVGGMYLEKLRFFRDALPSNVRLNTEGDGHEGLLSAAQSAGLVVSLKLPGETVQGYVREVGESWAAIAQIEGGERRGRGRPHREPRRHRTGLRRWEGRADARHRRSRSQPSQRDRLTGSASALNGG